MNGEKKDWQPGDVDEHHGVGGTYQIVDGKRVLVAGSRTEHNPKVQIDHATGHRKEIKDKE